MEHWNRSDTVRLEFNDGVSHNFYEIEPFYESSGSWAMVRYGRVGIKGVGTLKEYTLDAAAKKFDEKIRKGYVVVTAKSEPDIYPGVSAADNKVEIAGISYLIRWDVNPFRLKDSRKAYEGFLIEKLRGKEIEACLASEWLDSLAVNAVGGKEGKNILRLLHKKLTAEALAHRIGYVPSMLIASYDEIPHEAAVDSCLFIQRNDKEVFEAACVIAALEEVERNAG